MRANGRNTKFLRQFGKENQESVNAFFQGCVELYVCICNACRTKKRQVQIE